MHGVWERLGVGRGVPFLNAFFRNGKLFDITKINNLFTHDWIDFFLRIRN